MKEDYRGISRCPVELDTEAGLAAVFDKMNVRLLRQQWRREDEAVVRQRELLAVVPAGVADAVHRVVHSHCIHTIARLSCVNYFET